LDFLAARFEKVRLKRLILRINEEGLTGTKKVIK
jgi:hypothetical protein